MDKLPLGDNQLNFDTSDRPNMGDADYVHDLVAALASDAMDIRKAYNASGDPDAHAIAQQDITNLIGRYAKELRADNADYVQTMTLAAQDAWLKAHGYGTDDTEPGEPVKALVADTVNRIISAAAAHENGDIGDDDAQFRAASAIEDAVSMLLGVENSADENG